MTHANSILTPQQQSDCIINILCDDGPTSSLSQRLLNLHDEHERKADIENSEQHPDA